MHIIQISKSNDENDYVIADLDDPFAVLFDNIVLMADSDGDPICGPFLTLPSKKEYPDYYEDIEKPIALDKIRNKVTKCECFFGVFRWIKANIKIFSKISVFIANGRRYYFNV